MARDEEGPRCRTSLLRWLLTGGFVVWMSALVAVAAGLSYKTHLSDVPDALLRLAAYGIALAVLLCLLGVVVGFGVGVVRVFRRDGWTRAQVARAIIVNGIVVAVAWYIYSVLWPAVVIQLPPEVPCWDW